ncbi:MAG TPA: histidine kinase, partial [Blastocatellia bacterium]|nr:histidine kinase [Blastocatellia bacterium]
LRMQLHPHFFFNTLNAISELVYRDAEAADRTITRLSELLRITLDTGDQEVTLREELEFLRKYVELEQMLFQERLRIDMEIDPGSLDALVPNMILQPLVENAIRHGIAPRSRGGRVDVSARARDGVLSLRVRDDGLGVPKDWKIGEQSGIGLANTRARLAYLYPDRHRFEVEPTEGGGLTVSLEIPFRQVDSEAGDEDQDRDS